jgi:DNA-binding MarR family transcriptional regulator
MGHRDARKLGHSRSTRVTRTAKAVARTPMQKPARADDAEGLWPLAPALEFMRRLWQLNHALERVSSHMTRHVGITAQQRMILRFVGKYPGMTAGQLATQLHLDPGTISAALLRLERQELLRRRRDPRDKRRVMLELTPAGRRLDRPADGTVERAVERLLEAADASSLETAGEVLTALSRLLEAQLKE